MSYLVFCTFDLKNASSQDYQSAYADLSNIGMEKVITADNGNNVVIPSTSVMGEFNGASVTSVRDNVRSAVKKAFSARGFDSEIFIVIGDNWCWAATTT